jgi:hypothetical protein
MNHDTTPITIQVPNDIVARIDASLPPNMTREHIVSLLISMGLSVASTKFATPANVEQDRANQVESVAMHLRDRLRMYLDKSGTREMSDEPEVVAAIEEVIGAAMASGWMYACYLLGNGCSLSDLDNAVTVISQEFDYKVEQI